MNHRAGLDHSQTLLFPERLEDYIAAENPVRFLDLFVGSLDLHTLGFAKARCDDTGRPPYDPAMLLRLYLYGYLHRVRSSRLLETDEKSAALDTHVFRQNHKQTSVVEMGACGSGLTFKSRATANSDRNREAELAMPKADGSGDFVRPQICSHISDNPQSTIFRTTR
jgi:hypothetical protein